MAKTASLHKAIEGFPPELRTPLWELTEVWEDRFVIPHQDFVDLSQTVNRLQEHTEDRLDRVEAAIEKLTAAQQRSEERLARVEAAIEKLTAAQQRSEERLDRLEAAQEKTELAVQKLTEAMLHLEKSMSDRFAELGSRWGIQTESAFRQTIRRILQNMDNVTVKEGWYGNRQVDVVIRNGEHILLEITARMKAKDIDNLYRSADDYAAKEGVEPTLMVATSYVSPRLMEKLVKLPRPIEIFSYEDEEDEF